MEEEIQRQDTNYSENADIITDVNKKTINYDKPITVGIIKIDTNNEIIFDPIKYKYDETKKEYILLKFGENYFYVNLDEMFKLSKKTENTVICIDSEIYDIPPTIWNTILLSEKYKFEIKRKNINEIEIISFTITSQNPSPGIKIFDEPKKVKMLKLSSNNEIIIDPIKQFNYNENLIGWKNILLKFGENYFYINFNDIFRLSTKTEYTIIPFHEIIHISPNIWNSILLSDNSKFEIINNNNEIEIITFDTERKNIYEKPLYIEILKIGSNNEIIIDPKKFKYIPNLIGWGGYKLLKFEENYFYVNLDDIKILSTKTETTINLNNTYNIPKNIWSSLVTSDKTKFEITHDNKIIPFEFAETTETIPGGKRTRSKHKPRHTKINKKTRKSNPNRIRSRKYRKIYKTRTRSRKYQTPCKKQSA